MGANLNIPFGGKFGFDFTIINNLYLCKKNSYD